MYIHIDHISKSFTTKRGVFHALKDVSLGIEEGTITGIVGRSGAGKSTLIRCLNALEKPDTGRVLFEGCNLFEMSSQELCDARHKMGMIFQSFNLLRRRNVLENVCLPLELVGMGVAQARQKAKKCLELVGLSHKEHDYPSQLSGGQAQRVAIARALTLDSKVLLCDEATSALDPQTTQEILQLLSSLNKALGLTIVLITHDIGIVRDICTHVAVMQEGQIVEAGQVEHVFTNPLQDITKTLVQSLFNSSVPPLLKERLVPHPPQGPCDIALQLIFSGQNAQRPVISELIHDVHAPINIAGGALDHLGATTYGTLVITLPHDLSTLHQVRSYLEQQSVKIEILGYLI